jgi:hypothetical protein
MVYYIYIENNKINGKGNCKCLNVDVLNIKVEEDVYNDVEKYIYKDGEIVLNPNYEAEQELKEKERIANLTCTKRVFALMLQELGITYTTLQALISTNEQAQLEWDLCVELERKNPLLDIMALQLGVTSEQLDGLFRYANGELTIEEFRTLYVVADATIEEEVNETKSDTEQSDVQV